MVKQRAVVISDFSGGEFGSLGSWDAPKGSFTGQNVVRYVDGSLGPRNGLKQYTLTGVAASSVNTNGVWLASAFWYQTAANTIYYFDPFNMAAQAVTSVVTAAGAGYQSALVDENIYLATITNGIREIDAGVGGTDTLCTNSPNAWAIASYGERLVAGGGAATPGRLFYSNAGDPFTWGAANYIDIGVGNYIVALVPLRNGLAIATQYAYAGNLVGYGYRWWILTGVPGVNDTLREVVQAQGPARFRGAALLPSGEVAFASGLGENVATFNGSTTRVLRHYPLGTKGVTDSAAVVPLRDENDVMYFGDVTAGSLQSFAYVRRHDTWTKQAFGEADVTDKVSFIPSATSQDLVVFADKSATPKFYAWQPYNDRPPFSSDSFASVLTPSSVYFTLPDIQAERGEQIAVRKVTVWFRDWDTGGSANQFAVNVTPIRQYESGDGTTQIGGGSSPSFSRAVGSSSTSGVNLRREWTFAEDYGDAARLKISDMRGVAIHRIEVILDTKPELA